MAELIKDGESGTYLEPVYALLRPGGLFVIDNALYRERVIDPQADTEHTHGVHRLNGMLKSDHRFEIAILRMVDGILIARKME